VALFFGLSGTGKTTLSADPTAAHRRRRARLERRRRVQLEGGLLREVIRLNADHEPEIYATTRTFGTVLENVAIDAYGSLDLDSDVKTENTRARTRSPARQHRAEGIRRAPQERHLLTADAFGVLLRREADSEQALYFFSPA